MTVPLGLADQTSVEVLCFYMIQYFFTSINVFFIVIAFGYLLPNISSIYSPVPLVSLLRGQFQKNPLLSLCFTICLFSMSGMYPYGTEEVLTAVAISVVPVKIYSNAGTMRKQILIENKGRFGVYRWVNLTDRRSCLGSSMNLGRRMLDYYSLSYLRSADTIITKALLKYGDSSFSLEILEYFIYNDSLTKKENAQLLLEREQYFLDSVTS